MKFIDEYRDAATANRYAAAIAAIAHKPWTIMEVCGGQTHAIVKFGVDVLLPPQITPVHGPGCPVCVTPLELIDKAVEIASRPKVIFCSFGDMLRVPLTTVSWSTAAMGQAAAQLLLELIDGNNNTGKVRNVTIPPDLVIRSSCGALKQQDS